MPPRSEIAHGEEVVFRCDAGYFREGAEKFRCNFGDWSVVAMPKCVGDPCLLPPVNNGDYDGVNYRAGQTIPHDSLINFSCHQGHVKTLDNPLQCKAGVLVPTDPVCVADGGQARAEAFHATADGGLVGPTVQSVMTPPEFPTSPAGGGEEEEDGDFRGGRGEMGRPCSRPDQTGSSVVYLNGRKVVAGEKRFPDGAVVSFACTEMRPGRRTSWQIHCQDGEWRGRAVRSDPLAFALFALAF